MIVICSDGASTDIGTIADGGISNIAQVRNIGIATYVALFQLDEVSYTDTARKVITFPNVRERSDFATVTDNRVENDGRIDGTARSDCHLPFDDCIRTEN